MPQLRPSTVQRDKITRQLAGLGDVGFSFASPGSLDIVEAVAQALPRTDVTTLRAQPALRRKAYHKALLACHPDKQHDASPRRRALALALFHALSAARATEAAAEVACTTSSSTMSC